MRITTAREAFARRLIDALLDSGYRSQRNAKSGVDVAPLAKIASVTREMARRYTEGAALPDVNKMRVIADWLGVRVAWLRDGEGERRPGAGAAKQEGGNYEALTPEAREVGLTWQRLSAPRREMVREVLFMLSLGENRFPWLLRGRPKSESYEEWERRQEQNFGALAVLERTRRSE